MSDTSPADLAALAAEQERQARVRANLALLDEVRDSLAKVPDLYRERDRLYLALRDDSVPYQIIAEHADVTPEAARVAAKKAKDEAEKLAAAQAT